jgi:site-specific recombinase XerD
MNDIIKRNTGGQVADVSKLSDSSKRYIRASISPNTERAYRAQVRKWQEWCADHDVSPFPANITDVVNWLTERADAGQSTSTIKAAVAGIKFGHDIAGMTFDTRAPELTKTLAGISRETARIPKQSEPIRGTDAIEVITPGPDATITDIRDAAIIAAGYLFALRRSELVGLDYAKHGDGDGVLRFTAHTIELTLVRSKTGQGKPEAVTIPRKGNEDAIDAIKRWVDAGSILHGSALFRRIFRGGYTIGDRLTAGSVARIVKRLVGADYSGHSLRVGFAVSAAEAGSDLRSIASVTRHKSLEMPRRYAERADQLKTSPYNREGVGLNRSHL